MTERIDPVMAMMAVEIERLSGVQEQWLLAEAEISRFRALADELAMELAAARDDLEDWGAYADEYFQEKWDLAGDLARIDAVLVRYREARK